MHRFVLPVVLCVVLGTMAAGYAVAQDPAATPGAESDLCASPVVGPASPEASPEIQTSGDPAAIATEVVEGVSGSLDTLACATPGATPTG